jgi:hypothetical protein
MNAKLLFRGDKRLKKINALMRKTISYAKRILADSHVLSPWPAAAA